MKVIEIMASYNGFVGPYTHTRYRDVMSLADFCDNIIDGDNYDDERTENTRDKGTGNDTSHDETIE